MKTIKVKKDMLRGLSDKAKEMGMTDIFEVGNIIGIFNGYYTIISSTKTAITIEYTRGRL